MARKDGSANQGIVADTVKADVLAVGTNARAVKTVQAAGDASVIVAAIDELRSAVAALALPERTEKQLAVEIDAMHKAAGAPTPDRDAIEAALKSFTTKTNMVADLTSSGTKLVTAITGVAGAIGIGLKALGL